MSYEPTVPTCGDCVHFLPHRDPVTRRIHPSKPAECAWRPPQIKWPQCYDTRGLFAPYRSTTWAQRPASHCPQFSPIKPNELRTKNITPELGL